MKMIRLLKKSVLATVLAGFCLSALAELHIIIPGGPGGGWDTTARSVGEALMKSSLESRTSFQNMSGGGGGRAIAYMIEIGNKKNDILMVNSPPIVIRALSGAIPFSHRDLTPVADYPEIPTLKSLGISRSTARRYLEYLLESTELMVDQNYGAIGRPERSYRKCR